MTRRVTLADFPGAPPDWVYNNEYVSEWAETDAMDRWLDHLETLCIALTQRRMTKDHLDRYGRLLQGAEQDALRRIRGGPRTPRMIRRPAA